MSLKRAATPWSSGHSYVPIASGASPRQDGTVAGDGIGAFCMKCGHEIILTRTSVWCSSVQPTPDAGPPCPPTCTQCGEELARWDKVPSDHKVAWSRAQGAPPEVIPVLARHRPRGTNHFWPTCLCPRPASPEYTPTNAELERARLWLREHGLDDDWAVRILTEAANDPTDTFWELPDRTVRLSKAEAIALLDSRS
jgi:hypothetical protein